MADLLKWAKDRYEDITPWNEDDMRAGERSLAAANQKIAEGRNFRYGPLARPQARQQFVQQNQAPRFDPLAATIQSLREVTTRPELWNRGVNLGDFRGSGLLEDFINSPFKQGRGLVNIGQGNYKKGLGEFTTGLIEGPGGFIPLSRVAEAGRGASLATRALAGAKTGLIEGGVSGGLYGAGQAATQEAPFKDILRQAAISGAIGGVAGGVIGGGLPVARAGVVKGAKAIASGVHSASKAYANRVPLNQSGHLQINNPDKAKTTGLQVNDPYNLRKKPLEINNPEGAKTGPLKITDKFNLQQKPLSGAAQQSFMGKLKKPMNEGGYAKIPGKRIAPDLNLSQREFVNEYANMLEGMDKQPGVSIRPDGTRATSNSAFYRRVFADKGRPPTKAEWFDEARTQLKSGKAAYGASEEFKSIAKSPIASKAPTAPQVPKVKRNLSRSSKEIIPEINKYADTFGITKTQAVKDLASHVATPESMGKAQLPKIQATRAPKITPPKSLGEAKPAFMEATNKYLGSRQAAKSEAVANIRQLPKIKGGKSLDLVDAIQTGASKGDFGKTSGAVRSVLDRKYAELQAAKVDLGYLEDYFPQKWKNATADQVNQAYQALNQRAGFQNTRVIPTVKEGIKLGFTPEHTDYRLALNDYVNSADKLIANKKYFDDLKSKGLVNEAGTRPNGMQVIDAPGIPQPRPHIDPETGNSIQGNYYAKPDVAKELNKLFSPDIRGTAGNIVAKTGKASSATQTLFLSGGVPGTPLNAFGAAQWTKQALSGHPISATKDFFRAFSETATRNYETKNLPYIQKMEKAGVPYHGTLDAKSLTTVGERIADLHGAGKAKGAILEAWNKAVEDPTFRRYIPTMQLDVFKQTYARLIKRGLSEAEATAKAAEATRNGFGLNTMAKDALKSPVGRDVSRTVFFAPKYRESMVNFWGKNIKALGKASDPAYRENLKFLANATVLFGAMQVANMALNEGKTTFQNDNPNDRFNLSIPRGGGKSLSLPFLSSIATVPRVAANAAVDIGTGNFKEAGLEGKKLLSQLVRPPVDLLTNQKYNGREVYNPKDSKGQRLKDQALYTVGQYNHPYVQAGINAATGKSSGALETAATATELPIRFRNYDSRVPYGSTKPNTSKFDTLEQLKASKPKGVTLQQLADGKYGYTLSDGSVHSSTKLSSARSAIQRDAFGRSGKNIQVIGDTVLRRSQSGSIYTTTKTSYDYQVNTAKLTAFRNADNLSGYVKTAKDQLQNIQKQLKDPSTDSLEAARLQNQAAYLQKNIDKYKGYGGFTKYGSKGGGGRSGGRGKALLASTFKTAKISRPKGVKVKAPKLANFKAPKTRKLSVSKLPSNYLTKKLA